MTEPEQNPRTWRDEAKMFADGAERAKAAGDMEAWLRLSTAAIQCQYIADQLERDQEYMQ